MGFIAGVLAACLLGCAVAFPEGANASAVDCSSVVALTPHLTGRPGTLYGSPVVNQWWPWKDKKWNVDRVRVQVKTATAQPAAGCEVKWDAGVGASNGWVFPVPPGVSGADGVVEAFWIAGSAAEQRLAVSTASGATATITGKAQGERSFNGGYVNYNTDSDWDYLKMDITEVSIPKGTWFSTLTNGPFYTGINTPITVVFENWWAKDPATGKFVESLLLDPPNVHGHYAFNNATHRCGTGVGPEGGTSGCDLWYNTTVGHKYGFEIEKRVQPVTPQRPQGSTIISAWFNDYTLGIRRKQCTVEYMAQMHDSGFRSFPERYGDYQSPTCLELETVEVVVHDAKYRPVGQQDFRGVEKVVFNSFVEPVFGTPTPCGCINDYAGFEEDGLHIVLGGRTVGFPSVIESDVISYGDGPGQVPLPTHNFQTRTSAHPATCTDGLKNADEFGIDCGGHCSTPCSEGPGCHDGIQDGDEEYIDCGGSCSPCSVVYHVPQYFKVPGPRVWQEARAACQSQGGKLATIANPYQHMAASKICDSECWIGMYRDHGCSDFTCWKWDDGQQYVDTIYDYLGCCTFPYGPTNTAVKMKPLYVDLMNWEASDPSEQVQETLCAKLGAADGAFVI